MLEDLVNELQDKINLVTPVTINVASRLLLIRQTIIDLIDELDTLQDEIDRNEIQPSDEAINRMQQMDIFREYMLPYVSKFNNIY